MSSSVGSVFGGMQKRIDGLGSSLAKLKRQSSDITKLQTAQGRMAEASAKGNTAAVARYQGQIEKLSSSLRAAGVNTSNLTAEQARLASQIRGVEGQLGRVQRWNMAWSGLKTSALNVGAAFGKVKDNVTGLATKLGVLGTAAGYLFKTQFVDTAAEFEKLQTILKTLEGGNVQKAKQAFGWINDFAAKTPYDLKTVTDAFVKLRAYGIDPIKGDTLKSLGDTASAMGKSIMDAVEAIADAVTGENERLKEFGIKAAKDGGRIIYSYTDRAGKQRQKAVDASNRDLIRSTLTAIWNEKYAGAMEEQSRTWQGMMSNLGDQWTRFTARVMASGLFDWMKGKLGGVLDELNRAADDGRLKMWAEQTGAAIKEFFVNAWELGKSIRDLAVTTAEFVGGWKNLGIILGAVALAPTALSIINLGVEIGSLITKLPLLSTALTRLGVSVTAALGPWGLLAAAIATAALAIYKNWGGIGDWWDENVGTPLSNSIATLKDKFVDWGWIEPPSWKSNALPVMGQSMPEFIQRQSRFSAPSVLMPAANMPETNVQKQATINQDIKMFITAPPGSDGQSLGNDIRSKLKEPDLYDAAAEFMRPQPSR